MTRCGAAPATMEPGRRRPWPFAWQGPAFSRLPGHWILFLGLLAWILGPPQGVTAASLQVEMLPDGKVVVEAEQVPLLRLLAEMARYTEAEIFVAESLAADPVSITLPPMPVDRALQKLLRPYDFLASFRRDPAGESRLRLVKVYPRGDRRGNLARVHARGGAAARPAGGRGMGAAVGSRRLGMSGGRVTGAVFAGSHLALVQPLRRRPSGDRDVGTREAWLSPVRDIGTAWELAGQEALHEEWRLTRATKTPGDPAEHAAVAADAAMAQRLVGVRQEAILANLQRLQYLQEEGLGDAFAVSLPAP